MCANDASLALQADCRTLDFTLASSLFAIFAANGLRGQRRRAKRLKSTLDIARIACALVILVAEFIVLSQARQLFSWAIAASATACSASFVLVVLLYRQLHDSRPRTVLPAVYLLLLLFFDAARLRSFVLSGVLNDHIVLFGAFAASYGTRASLLLLENLPAKVRCAFRPSTELDGLTGTTQRDIGRTVALLALRPPLLLSTKADHDSR